MRLSPTAACFHNADKSYFAACCIFLVSFPISNFQFFPISPLRVSFFLSFHHCHLRHFSALGFSYNMTKRDSCLAGITSPRAPTSMQRRHLHFEGQSSSGATFSGQRPQPGSVMGNLAPQSLPGIDYDGSSSHYGYTATAQSVPLPDAPAHQTPIYNLYVKKPTHSRLKLNNSIEFSIPTLSQRSVLLINQKPVASW